MSRIGDAETLLRLLDEFIGLESRMWGAAIASFGRYHYQYKSGREGESMLMGFSTRKTKTSVYMMPGYRFGQVEGPFERLGRHKLGKSCLYLNNFDDIDERMLREIIADGVNYLRASDQTWGR